MDLYQDGSNYRPGVENGRVQGSFVLYRQGKAMKILNFFKVNKKLGNLGNFTFLESQGKV